MAFASFFRRSRRPSAQQTLERAVRSTLEPLETRLLMSTSRHRTRLQPSEILSGGTIGFGLGAPSAVSVSDISTMYGMSQLGTTTTNPLFTNSGAGQSIFIIGAPVSQINDTPTVRTGNLNKFSAGEKIPRGGVNFAPITEAGFNFVPNQGDFGLDDQYTTAVIEWAHALAPLASLTLVAVPVTRTGVVTAADLSLGIQEAVRQAQLSGRAGPINGTLPGGVILMGATSVGEDATLSGMYDSLFSYKYASNDSFIAPTGDVGGTVSMPATSPYVTAVGGTTFNVDATGTRVYEIANLNAGGGASSVERLPGFQAGLRANGKPLTTRGVPDVALAANSIIGGMDVYWDPTPDNSQDSVSWGAAQGTGISAAMFSGMVAVANELRQSNGLGPVGRDLNNEIYKLHSTTPGAFFDITQGNNTLFQAGVGYDYATGLGAPQANTLVEGLAGTASQSTSTLVGTLFLANNSSISTNVNLNIPFRGTASFNIGTQFLTLTSLSATGSATSLDSNGQLTQTPFTATGVQTGLIYRNPNNTFTGRLIVTVAGAGQSESFNVVMTGKIITSRNRAPRIQATLTTVNSRGQKIPFGSQDIFQASLTT